MPIIRKHIKSNLSLNYYEKQAWNQGKLVCGIDEVGRGCFAGPLVVGAAVIKQPQSRFSLLQDSKLLTVEQRQASFQWIKNHCFYATAIVSPQDIDRLNIYYATLKGMRQAFSNLVSLNSYLLEQLRYVTVDAMPLTLPKIYTHSLEIHHFSKGEFYSKSIAAASIVAKIVRDKLMETIDPLFPTYSLKKHKGYGTSLHQRKLQNHGPSIIHRTSFINKIKFEQSVLQRSLFEENEYEKLLPKTF